MAPPQIDQLSTPLHTMTQTDFLSLGLLILSQNQEITTHFTKKLHFKCSICGKAFPSYQALGGHKSSHRRLTNPDQIKPADIQQNLISLLDSHQGNLTHRCNVCFRSFSTGQALGGHKRCHYWEGSNGSVSESSVISSLSSVRDFDLNFPPRNGWGEDEEVLSPLPVKKQRLI